jgi:hypothetical protein
MKVHGAGCDAGGQPITNSTRGLEGFLLPRYLALRLEHIGHVTVTSLLQALLHAQAEELRRHRVCTHDRTPRGAWTGNRARGGDGPRKRTAGHADDGAAAATAGTRCETSPPGHEPAKRSTVSAGGRRQRGKRRCRSRGSANPSGAEARGDRDGGDWLHYQTMACLIVAPYTPLLIALVHRIKVAERERERAAPAAAPAAPPATPCAAPAPAALANVYQRSQELPCVETS